ncbi:MAG TPA: hypothetical protein VN726_16155 [Hanamia sp.]|nr:hypothetical protein [Hanamia sp.]
MARKMFTRSTFYLLAIVLGIGLILLSIFVLILAIQHNDLFRIFLQVIQLVLWTVFTIIYFRLYKKGTASL